MNAEFVLDASALLSILLHEGVQERVAALLDRSRIHAVNLAEVVGRLVRSGMPPDRAADASKTSISTSMRSSHPLRPPSAVPSWVLAATWACHSVTASA